ncbi:hypothetical protein B0H13DRAFT_1882989 [Mycena leptocephala]|nr:hypothetical protein B0H13DRAFT_1882989 [Mycena leptocephala]
MPSTLLHREWIEQLAVRWLTPPVVDVLERGAYTSPLTRTDWLTEASTIDRAYRMSKEHGSAFGRAEAKNARHPSQMFDPVLETIGLSPYDGEGDFRPLSGPHYGNGF